MDWLYQNLPFLCLLLLCLLDGRRIVTGTRSFSHAYDRLSPEEKRRYAPHKIRRLGVVWLGTIAALTLVLRLPHGPLANDRLLWVLVGCMAAALLAYPLLAHSRWALDRFCQTDNHPR